jgi:hypothetical protein
MHKQILLIFLIITSFASNAQRTKGSWKDYLSYANATKVAISTEKVFCVTEGGLFYYDFQDNSISKISGKVPLSDFGIKTIAYSIENNVLVVAYKNSNIDLIYDDGSVINLSDIKRKQITGDKSINNISFSGSEAYFSTGFGVVVLNLEKKEIKATYLIGEEGNALAVNDIAIHNRKIYAATDKGLRWAEKEGTNLQDFNNWFIDENIPHPSGKFNQLEIHAGELIANYTPEEWYSDEMYILNGNNWQPYLTQIRFAFDIQAAGDYMVIASRDAVFIIDKSHTIIGKINAYQFGDEQVSPIHPKSAGVSADGTIWVADYENVLVRITGNNFEKAFPSGPFDNDVFSLYQYNSDLWIAPGGMKGWEIPRFQRFGNDEWDYFTKKENPELDGFFNILSIAVDPFDENHFFVASWGGGVLEYKNDEFVQRYTNLNSPLETALPAQPEEPYTRIGGLDFDSEGNLWVTNAAVAHNLHKLSPAGEWQSFVLPKIANLWNTGEVIVNKYDDKWVLVLYGHDIYVIDKTGTNRKQLLVTSYFNNGQNEIFNRMSDVYSIAEDNEGAIWVGTSKGVALYNNPSRIWDSEPMYATQPSLDLNDGVYHPLLATETVTAIAVDGANRKWFGTKESGVFLISENGDAEVLHFTKENSSLLSNKINAIAINQKSGEVFFGTDKGLVSYQGDAISGKGDYSNVYVYPNPVRETYDGPVTITGLIENTDIKITDISGNLVFKTTSLGGQAVWDGRNLNGRRVKTGVYLVFCNDETGEQTQITKLLFIH